MTSFCWPLRRQNYRSGGSPRPSQLCKYKLLVKVNKTKVMASDGVACRLLIQNEQLEQVDTLPNWLVQHNKLVISKQ